MLEVVWYVVNYLYPNAFLKILLTFWIHLIFYYEVVEGDNGAVQVTNHLILFGF